MSNAIELTEQELSWKGSYTVTYYDEKVKEVVACQYQSVQSFVDHNNIPSERLEAIKVAFFRDGKFEMDTEHGVVGIYDHGYFS